jgi:hypothetical protein
MEWNGTEYKLQIELELSPTWTPNPRAMKGNRDDLVGGKGMRGAVTETVFYCSYVGSQWHHAFLNHWLQDQQSVRDRPPRTRAGLKGGMAIPMSKRRGLLGRVIVA